VLLFISLSASYISPNKIWFLPFWGLLLPAFVFINLIFVLMWIVRKRYFAVVSLLAIGICLPQLFKLGATNIFKRTNHPSSDAIKVMSYNVRDFDLYNWSENINSKEKIFQTIREKSPDVICFQEFYNDTTKEFNTVKQLKELGYKYYFFTRELVLRNTDEWGIALFSKLPIREHGNIMKQAFKTGYGKKPFKGLYADIAFGDTVIRFVNVHLQSIYFGAQDYETIEEFRSTQNLDEHGVRSIVRKLKEAFKRRALQADTLSIFLKEQTKPVILCGDFNDLPNSYVANKTSKNMKDAFLDYGFGIGHTYNGKIPFLRIDRILTSPSFDITYFKVIPNKISDHFPIYMECTLSSKKEN
jgi:endonuclease/exonuclease/phosphatase family metal-dependent hydrolase